MKELSPGTSTPLVLGWGSLVVPSIDGLAVPLVEEAVSPFVLRFFADFDSTGTVPAVAMVRARAESDSIEFGVEIRGWAQDAIGVRLCDG